MHNSLALTGVACVGSVTTVVLVYAILLPTLLLLITRSGGAALSKLCTWSLPKLTLLLRVSGDGVLKLTGGGVFNVLFLAGDVVCLVCLLWLL